MKTIEKRLQETMNKLAEWSNTNGMKFSQKKTKFFIFTRSRKEYFLPKLYLNDLEIESVPNFKFLGMFFYSSLPWKTHVSSCNSRLRIIKIVANTKCGTEYSSAF